MLNDIQKYKARLQISLPQRGRWREATDEEIGAVLQSRQAYSRFNNNQRIFAAAKINLFIKR